MGKGGGGNFQVALDFTDAQAIVAGPDQQADDVKAGRVAQFFQAKGGFFQFHAARVRLTATRVNDISRTIEL